MKCRDAIELLGGLVDGDLGRAEHWRVRLHLLICQHCRSYLASYRATIAAARAAFHDAEAIEESVPDEQVEAILKAARKE